MCAVGHHRAVQAVRFEVELLEMIRIWCGLTEERAAALVQKYREDLVLLLINLGNALLDSFLEI